MSTGTAQRTDDLSSMVARLHGMAAALSGAQLRTITTAVAVDNKNDALAALDRDLPRRKFTNWRPKLFARFTVLDDTTAIVKALPVGPWDVLTAGRWPGSKGRRNTRTGVKRAVAWGPTRGKGTWNTATANMVRANGPRIQARMFTALTES